MRTGALISGAAHAALIAAAVWGLPWLTPREREPIEVASVSFVTDAEFEAAQAAAATPAAAPEQVVEPEPAPETAEAPDPTPTEQIPDTPPPAADTETAMLAPDFAPEAPLQAPDGTLAPVEPARISPQPPTTVMVPRARPSVRIEPDATPPPPEESREAEVPRAETTPEPDVAEPLPEQPAEAPPEAAPEPVAEPSPPVELALQTSGRPKSRPRQERTEQIAARTPDPEPQPEPTAAVSAPDPEPEPEPPAGNRQTQITDLVASAAAPAAPTTSSASATTAGTGSAASGPPLSAGEKDGLRLAVQQCWNVPAGLREAQELRVVLAAELTATGDVVDGSIRLLDPDPVPDTRFQRAFDAGRRALIRCAPYSDLPRDKYAQWRSIEVVFDPEGMVSW